MKQKKEKKNLIFNDTIVNFICMYFKIIKYILWLSSVHEDFEKLGTRVDKAYYPLDLYTFLF